jgi:hypothetical protein
MAEITSIQEQKKLADALLDAEDTKRRLDRYNYIMAQGPILIERVEKSKQEGRENGLSEEENHTLKMFKLMNKQCINEFNIVVDLEAASNTEVAAIGAIVGGRDGTVYKSYEEFLAESELQFSPRCKREFWDKQQKLTARVKESTTKKEEMYPRFAKFLDTAHTELPKHLSERDIGCLSNNPEFDYSRTTPGLLEFANREPSRYTSNGEYRSITDLGEFTWALGIADIIGEAATKVVKHDHFPVNDAENILITNVIANNVAMEIKKLYLPELIQVANRVCQSSVEEIQHARKMRKIETESTQDN